MRVSGEGRSSRATGRGFGPTPFVSLGLLASVLTACTLAPAPEGGPSTSDSDVLPPPGYGTLRQEEISMAMRSEDLEVMVTPLAESFIRVTAPDTYERLAGVARRHRTAAPEGSALFLVSFFTQQPEVRFVPEEVQLLSRGLRLRPRAILPVTPTWGQHRVRQRNTETAVYAFPPDVDLESELALAYGLRESGDWQTILSRVQAERARARARAGIGGPGRDRPQASSSYLEILR